MIGTGLAHDAAGSPRGSMGPVQMLEGWRRVVSTACVRSLSSEVLSLSFNHGEATDWLREQPLTVRGTTSEGAQAEASNALVTAG